MAHCGLGHYAFSQNQKNTLVPIEVYNEEYFMRQALQEAALALEEGEIPVGAVVVANKRVIARAHNQVERLNDATAHAEMLAMTSASNYLGSKYLTDCTLYVTLEPCTMCAGGMYWSQLAEVVYGAGDEKRGYARLGDGVMHPKTKVRYGVMEAEAQALLAEFFKKLRGT